MTDRVALARSGITSRSAVAADPVVALLIAKDIAAGACGKLRPAALERPTGCWRGSNVTPYGVYYARGEKKNEENHGND